MRHAARDEAAGPAAALRPAGARRVPARPFPPAAKWYLLYGLALIALWISGVQAWWASQDAANFHIPQIRLILEQGAWRAFLQPIVAMPIGFHLAAAGLHAATGIDAALAGRLLSLLCMVAGAAFTWGLSRRFGERAQLVNLMVLLLSWPLWSASMSSVTDTMGFALFALFALCVAEERHIAAGASLGALVLVRQYYAAPALALVASALWGWLRAAHHRADQSSRTEGPRGPSPWATGLA